MNEIRLFVSGYQRHFWISARHATEALYRAPDKELHVELFLVGILREDTADRHTVCLEPEDCGFDPGAVQRYQRRDGAAVARLASDQSFELRPEAESALEKLVSPSERKGEPPVGLGVYFKLIEIVETLKPIYADFGTKDHVRLVAIRHQLASVGPLVLDEKHEADELTLNQFRPTARQFDHYLATDGRLAGPADTY